MATRPSPPSQATLLPQLAHALNTTLSPKLCKHLNSLSPRAAQRQAPPPAKYVHAFGIQLLLSLLYIAMLYICQLLKPHHARHSSLSSPLALLRMTARKRSLSCPVASIHYASGSSAASDGCIGLRGSSTRGSRNTFCYVLRQAENLHRMLIPHGIAISLQAPCEWRGCCQRRYTPPSPPQQPHFIAGTVASRTIQSQWLHSSLLRMSAALPTKVWNPSPIQAIGCTGLPSATGRGCVSARWFPTQAPWESSLSSARGQKALLA